LRTFQISNFRENQRYGAIMRGSGTPGGGTRGVQFRIRLCENSEGSEARPIFEAYGLAGRETLKKFLVRAAIRNRSLRFRTPSDVKRHMIDGRSLPMALVAHNDHGYLGSAFLIHSDMEERPQ
jgi:hypothetical protein